MGWPEQISILTQPSPSLAPQIPAPAPLGGLLPAPDTCSRIPGGFYDHSFPCFPVLGPCLDGAFSELWWVSQGQAVNNSPEHWLCHQGLALVQAVPGELKEDMAGSHAPTMERRRWTRNGSRFS